MKGKLRFFYLVIGICCMMGITESYAQTITYSIPLNDNVRNTSFNIIGLCQGNLMIYKKAYNDYSIALYERDMKLKDIVPLKFLPNELDDADFVNLGDKVLMVYQYTRRRDIYCNVVLLDKNGLPLEKPLNISKTIHPEKVVGDKPYAVIYSENKSRIMVYQVLRNEDSLLFHIRTCLLDTAMHLLQTDEFTVPYSKDSDKLQNMTLSNSGDLYFTLGSGLYSTDHYFVALSLYCRTTSGTLHGQRIPFEGHLPQNRPLLKLDEENRKVWITTLNYGDKQRNIDYLFTGRYSLGSLNLLSTKLVIFSDSLKDALRSKGDVARLALNTCVLSQQVMDKRGNVLLAGEKRYEDGNGINHYDDLLLFDLDSSGNILQAHKIEKKQADDLKDIFSSYLMINTGGALHFLLNKSHKTNRFLNNVVYLLTDYRYDANHQLKEMPVIRGLDNKKKWAPQYGEQISRNEVVIPCVTGSVLLFGKITY